MKPVKGSVSAVIDAPDAAGPGRRVLLVRRPWDDEELPGLWGLPAASLRPGEEPADAVERIGTEKLGVELAAGAELREGTLERPHHLLHMKLFAARIVEGEPAVPQPVGQVTQYIDWRWGGGDDLVPAARRGSLCCRLYLRELGRGWTS